MSCKQLFCDHAFKIYEVAHSKQDFVKMTMLRWIVGSLGSVRLDMQNQKWR